MIKIPERDAEAIDLMDQSLDQLLTCWLALGNTGWLDSEAIDAVRCALLVAIDGLRPVRAVVNEMHGRNAI